MKTKVKKMMVKGGGIAAGVALLAVLFGNQTVLAGPGKASKSCPTSVKYQCQGDTHEYTATCAASGNYADGSSDKGWIGIPAQNGNPCGTYNAFMCDNSPDRSCVGVSEIPGTKVTE